MVQPEQLYEAESLLEIVVDALPSGPKLLILINNAVVEPLLIVIVGLAQFEPKLQPEALVLMKNPELLTTIILLLGLMVVALYVEPA